VPSSTSSTELIEVARVRGAHGLTGLVKVELHWGQSTAFSGAERAVLELSSGERRELAIERATGAGKSLLVKFEGVADRDAAAALGGARILLERTPLAEGEMYLVDLVGAEVIAPDGPVGRVVDVRVNPSVDSLLIETSDGKRLEQPLTPGFIARLDVEARRVYLANRDGLFE
jgi:16S rRNA processing protein RimM